MPKKLDGVIEAVRYTPTGLIDVVRAYERRGFTYSDRILLDRKTLLDRIKKGQKIVVGQRKPYLGSTFETGKAIILVEKNGQEILTTNSNTYTRDELEETPAF